MDRKQVQGESSRLKEELENLAAEEQLRTEQAKLGGLEDGPAGTGIRQPARDSNAYRYSVTTLCKACNKATPW